jgi:DNA replication protein DnaC
MKRIEDSKDQLLKDNYEWILKDPTLEKWRDGNANSLLWIKGDPGKGKTMLMIALVRELVKSVTARHGSGMEDAPKLYGLHYTRRLS